MVAMLRSSGLIDRYQLFRRTSCLYLQGRAIVLKNEFAGLFEVLASIYLIRVIRS